MPCNCRQCDCSDRSLCYLIQSRLKSLACVIDKAVDGTLSAYDQLALLAFTDMKINGCGLTVTLSGGVDGGRTMGDSSKGFLLKGNDGDINIFGSLAGLTLMDFVPQINPAGKPAPSGLAVFFVCIPMPDASGFCMQCTAVPTAPELICSLDIPQETPADTIKYLAALAQNFRYWADVYGC